MVDSLWSVQGDTVPNPVRVDETDLSILAELSKDARIANNVLAAKVGLAPSTCLGRVKALSKAGVITGYHAAINEELLGVAVNAMISVIVSSTARDRLLSSAHQLRELAEVKEVFVLGGSPDLLVRVATRSIGDLRTFVAAHLGSNRAFSSTQTVIIFEHLA
ncbi:MAG TPA: Lrp/AsnC family transcriptional regulator [Glutamicibacter sp.]|uniref:Lrp/AsnC family transcriptional regulator n=1 Tax=Glutamicibacter arilaitensis TaxID=256701 RepID=A0A2N7S0D8_9MICC|nr:Lrp/AsnC family transcriptional regulator [Glutamicibacter arilaitensis]HCH47907.1 Lrp/AsnC family transcriptional regulator [Glutamicibacter sp.]HCJ53404.1 Lrp/AsnC family transcriptional regulator [Glutamicibacter sp.]HCM93784.1 Lrp/AsnC family transcriptional regulator [Glutamicibacter sp.]